MPISQLDEYAETFMAQRISMVAGVAQVKVFGSAKYAVRIQLDPSALAHRQIGIDEVANAINDQNVNLPTGVLNGPNKAYTVQANGQLQDAAAFRRLIVVVSQRRAGAPRRPRPGARRRAEQQVDALVQRRRAASSSPFSASPARTPSRSPTR